MFRFAAALLLLAGSLLANSFTATTTSEGGTPCSNTSQSASVTCDGGSNTPFGGGRVTSAAGFGGGSMAFATLTLEAVCHTVADCLSQSGFADAQVDLAIHGPAGTPGLLEFIRFNPGTPLMTGFTTVTGLTLFNINGPHGGSVFNFVYEEPFHVGATIQGGCSECELFGSARISAPFYIYDLNMNLLGTISSPLEAAPAPEPGTAVFLSAGLLLMAWRRFSS